MRSIGWRKTIWGEDTRSNRPKEHPIGQEQNSRPITLNWHKCQSVGRGYVRTSGGIWLMSFIHSYCIVWIRRHIISFIVHTYNGCAFMHYKTLNILPCSFNESLLSIISLRVSFPYAAGFFKDMPCGKPSILMPYSKTLLYGILAFESFTC